MPDSSLTSQPDVVVVTNRDGIPNEMWPNGMFEFGGGGGGGLSQMSHQITIDDKTILTHNPNGTEPLNE